jgi:hypothetical protein
LAIAISDLPSVSKTIDDCEDSIAMSLLGLIQDVDAATEIAAAIIFFKLGIDR